MCVDVRHRLHRPARPVPDRSRLSKTAFRPYTLGAPLEIRYTARLPRLMAFASSMPSVLRWVRSQQFLGAPFRVWWRRNRPSLVGFCSLLLAVGTPSAAFADNSQTLNASSTGDNFGILLSSAPASCLSVPNGAYETKGTFSGCEERGAAAVTAAGHTGIFADTSWSDLDHSSREDGVTALGERDVDLNGVETFSSATDAKADTNYGPSWMPKSCVGPTCGHFLRGDVKQFDENGDGQFNGKWIDKNGDGVINSGEIDRLRADQFAWGATSVALTQEELTLGTGANLFPAGTRRMGVRFALGQTNSNDPAATLCNGEVANPDGTKNMACFDLNENPPNVFNVEIDHWAQCDPDKFDPDTHTTIANLGEAQRSLDNCLWFYASVPQGFGVALPGPEPHPGDPGWVDPTKATQNNDGQPCRRVSGWRCPVQNPIRAIRVGWIRPRPLKTTTASRLT